MAETYLHELAAGLPPDIREKIQTIFGKITATWEEINRVGGVTPGTSKASAVAVLGANKNLDTLVIADSGLKLGSGAGTAITATAAEINKLAGVSGGTVTASKALVVGANKNLDNLFFGAVVSAALLHGGGTSVSPLESAVADKNFLGYWTKSTAPTGDNRLAYLRHYLTNTGGGECLRAFTTVDPASDIDAGTAHGGHISLNFGATYGKLSGLGTGCRNTLHIPNRAITLGTMAAHQAEVYMDGTSANPIATRLSLYRGIVDGGDVTAQNKLTHVMDLVNLGAVVFANQSAWSVSKVLKICVNGTDYYLPLSTAP